MPSYTIAQIAEAINATAVGDTSLIITSLAEPADAGPGQLAMAMSAKYLAALSDGGAEAAVLAPDTDWQALGLKAAILPRRPRYAMAGMTAMMDLGQGFGNGIHPTAVIDPSATLGADVSVGPNSVIGPRAQIGDRFIAQPGARIGGDGFSFVTPEPSQVEAVRDTLGDQSAGAAQSYARIHSVGAVRIGHDVEVGANATIDNGTIRDTQVGDGTKFDNLTQTGHNVIIGRDCLICAQAGIAGSTTIGNNVVLGGQSGVSDNIFIGDNVITGGGTIVLSNIPAGRVMLGYPAMKMNTSIVVSIFIPAGRVMLGYPAMKMDTTMEVFKGLRRLKRLYDDVASLKKAVSNRPPKD